MERDSWNEEYLGSGGDLVQWKLSRIYDGDPNKDSYEWVIRSLNRPSLTAREASGSRSE